MGKPTVAPDQKEQLIFLGEFDDIAPRPRQIVALARLLELAIIGFKTDHENSGELIGDWELIEYLASSVQCVTSIAADAAEQKAVA